MCVFCTQHNHRAPPAPPGASESDREEDRPTEEERLAWEERQQQRDKLSGLMGQYMLKGYRMLGSSCGDCGVRNVCLGHI